MIYVLTTGEYSDYKIVGLFTTKELAEAFMEKFNIDGTVEEYELDVLDQYTKMEELAFKVLMKKDGTVEHVNITDDVNDAINTFVGNNKFRLWCTCFAKDKEHAIKITNEKRLQLIANNKM